VGTHSEAYFLHVLWRKGSNLALHKLKEALVEHDGTAKVTIADGGLINLKSRLKRRDAVRCEILINP
jgi:hypothetical protein